MVDENNDIDLKSQGDYTEQMPNGLRSLRVRVGRRGLCPGAQFKTTQYDYTDYKLYKSKTAIHLWKAVQHSHIFPTGSSPGGTYAQGRTGV